MSAGMNSIMGFSPVKYLGLDDSVQICGCCGKSNLKHTVALEFDGEIRFYGVVCAGRALGIETKTGKDVAAAVNEFNKLKLIENKVDTLRANGSKVVYGRFYINSRGIKSQLCVQVPSELMIHQIYPARV